MSEVEKWGDAQQYRAEAHSSYEGPERGVMPRVTLLSMTPDPLGSIGAMAAMYEGRVVRSLDELSHSDRVRYWQDMRKTHLDTPLEAVLFHFLIEGVDRSFTHQLVRKRTGTAFAQESLRFAVPGRLNKATSLPPSLQGTSDVTPVDADTAGISQAQGWRETWDSAMGYVDAAYHALVASGMPAEEARGLLPHATATRIHYVINLRSLLQEAGNRLCTQAQFHWKIVFAQIVAAIRQAGVDFVEDHGPDGWFLSRQHEDEFIAEYNLIADAFRPVCYELGRCPFKASFDRSCTIRERVEQNAEQGRPSSEWHKHHDAMLPGKPALRAIRPEEWLMNPGAARKVD